MPTATTTSAIVVVRPDVLGRIRQLYEADESIAIFDAADSMPPVTAVGAIARTLLLVESAFTDSQAGIEFLDRFREAHPDTEIRVFIEVPGGLLALFEQPLTHPVHHALRAASQPLRRVPGRREPRVSMPPDTIAIVNGVTVQLVNVSERGAQVVSPEVLRPGEHVHARLPDNPRRRAIVVWSAFEMLRESRKPGYRAGLSFA